MTPPGTHPPQTPPSADAPADASLDSQIDALLADPPAGTEKHAPDAVAANAEAAVASIERQVESLVDQFVEQPETAPTTQAAPSVPAATPSPAAAPPPDSIGELDDQLARLTDELLTAPAPEPFQAPSVKFAPTPDALADAISPEPTHQASPSVAPVTPVAPAAQAEYAAAAPTPIAAVPVAVQSAPRGPSVLVRIFSRPLVGKPRLVRDTAGWLGFNSLFLASVVWAYHLWFQKPEKLEAQHAPAALVSSDGHGESPNDHGTPGAHPSPVENAPAEHASAEHGAPDAHGAASGHPGEEPITGIQPLHRKKPTYALSAVMAERLNVAKKSSDGHGGGHGAEKKSGSGHGAPAKSGH